MSYCCQCNSLHNAYWGSCCSRACKHIRDAKVSAVRVCASTYEQEKEKQNSCELKKLIKELD